MKIRKGLLGLNNYNSTCQQKSVYIKVSSRNLLEDGINNDHLHLIAWKCPLSRAILHQYFWLSAGTL